MFKKIKQYLIISIVSVVFSLYLFEGYLVINQQISTEFTLKKQLYENQKKQKWDIRTKAQIYQDLKKTNNQIQIPVHPNYFLGKNYPIFPLSGISNSVTINCNENGYYSIYQSDRYGFNNPDSEWDNKKIEYLLVGDSFVHGYCVNRPNDIASHLRNLSKKSVLNLGYGGNGPLIEYAALREYLDHDVKKILWIYMEGNDLKNLKNERNEIILANYLSNINFTQKLTSKQNEIDNVAKKIIQNELFKKDKKKLKYKFLKFLRLNNTKKIILKGSSEKERLEPVIFTEFKTILKLSKELAIKNNSKIYFIYLPTYPRYVSTYDNTNYNLVKNIVKELSIPFIDIDKEVFKKEQNPLKFFPFEMFGHYNEDGYKKVSEIIYKLTKN
jgi:hypothetical protein